MKKLLKKSTTVYKRLLILFFTTLIPFFALSLLANHVAEERLRAQTEDRLEAQLQSMADNYEDLHFRVYSWMKVNLMTDYKVLLANGSINLSAYQLGSYVYDLFSSLQELSQMSDDIANITINNVFLVCVALICLAPLVYVLAVSFSANDAVKSGLVTFWPVKFTTIGYEYLLQNKMFWRSMLNSVIRVLLGTLINLLCTCLVAFPPEPDE